MSTWGEIASLASDLVVFLGAASLLAVLMLRPDLLRTTTLGRSVLAGAATLLATSALFHGALIDAVLREDLLDKLRAVAIVLLAAGAGGVGARWPRHALFAAVALLGVAQLAFDEGSLAGNVLRFAGGCTIWLSLWLAARRSLATRIAAVAAVLLVVVVLLLSGILSGVLRDNVAEQALERASDRARIEASLINDKSDDALSQADLVVNILRLSPEGRDAIRAQDAERIHNFLSALKSNYGEVDFLAFFNADQELVASATDEEVGVTVLGQLAGSPVVQEAFQASLAAPAVGVEPTLNNGLLALGVQLIEFEDERGTPARFGAVAAGFFLDGSYLATRVAGDERDATDLSIVTDGDRVLATTFDADLVTGSFSLLDGPAGEEFMQAVFAQGGEPERQGEFGGDDVFVAASPVPPAPPDAPPGGAPSPTAAVVVTVEGAVIEEARASLFQTLFLITLAAAALALALAAAAGARLGAPLRKLATTAEQISRGDLSVRSGLRSADEIGLLGSSFDEMAGSIERMASELREGAAQMEAVLNSMTDGLVAADPVGLVAMMNPAAETMLGVRASREMGKPVSAVIRAQDRTGASLADRFEVPNFGAWSLTGSVESRGTQLPVAISGAPILSEQGGVLGAVYVLRDMRRELEIERAKTEFLSNISHELRTPLTPIRGYADMLRRDQQLPGDRKLSPEKRGEFLDDIVESAERLERTVDILVNFAAMEAGRLVLQPEPVDVAALVGDICRRWRSRSDRHRVEEHVSGRPSLLADPRLLERSINELIDNAVKYSPEGGVVDVRAELTGSPDDRVVEISVADQGIGIAPADFERVFAEFSQVDGSATRRYGGLGLGLPFVQRVLAAHGGSIEVRSEPGHGSVFVMRLPVAGANGSRGNGSTRTRP